MEVSTQGNPRTDLRIGIVGSRRRCSLRDRQIVIDLVRSAVAAFPEKRIVLVSGGCPIGADKFAKDAVDAYGTDYVEFPISRDPPVKHRGEFVQRAYARNKQIAEYSDILFALVHTDRTGGTENTVDHSFKLGKKFFLVDEVGRCYLSGMGWHERNGTATVKA